MRAREIAARMAALRDGDPSRIVHVSGVTGGMTALLGRAIALADSRPVVCVTADLESARRLAEDLAFVWGGTSDEAGGEGGENLEDEVLLFTPPEASPYAEVNPDRRARWRVWSRCFILLEEALAWRFLVVPARGLGAQSRAAARDRDATSERIACRARVDRDKLIARLAAAGLLAGAPRRGPGDVRGARLGARFVAAFERASGARSSSTAIWSYRFARSTLRCSGACRRRRKGRTCEAARVGEATRAEKPRDPRSRASPRSQRCARLPPSSASYGSRRRARPS